MNKKVGIVGAGVVGTAVAVILFQKGWEITGVYDIRPESTINLAEKVSARPQITPQDAAKAADILFITTSDSAIEEVAGQIAWEGGIQPGQVVVHMSGALSSDVLSRDRACGAVVLSVHPLQSFANEERAVQNLPGSVFSIEGDEEGYPVAQAIVEALGGEYFFIDQKAKPLYHASACVVSNYLVTVIGFGAKLMESVGIPRQSAIKALLPLIEGTVSNIAAIGVPSALTGPIARGDQSTVEKHLEVMHEMTPHMVELYAMLGLHTVEVAEAKGTIDDQTGQVLVELFRKELERQIVAMPCTG